MLRVCRHIENGGVCKEPAETEILAQIHVSLESRKAGAGKTPASVYEVGRYTRRIKPQPRAAVAKTSKPVGNPTGRMNVQSRRQNTAHM